MGARDEPVDDSAGGNAITTTPILIQPHGNDGRQDADAFDPYGFGEGDGTAMADGLNGEGVSGQRVEEGGPLQQVPEKSAEELQGEHSREEAGQQLAVEQAGTDGELLNSDPFEEAQRSRERQSVLAEGDEHGDPDLLEQHEGQRYNKDLEVLGGDPKQDINMKPGGEVRHGDPEGGEQATDGRDHLQPGDTGHRTGPAGATSEPDANSGLAGASGPNAT